MKNKGKELTYEQLFYECRRLSQSADKLHRQSLCQHEVYLQHKTNDLVRSLAELEKDMEQRVTDNVLKALSVQLETGDAIREIDSLKRALDRLGE